MWSRSLMVALMAGMAVALCPGVAWAQYGPWDSALMGQAPPRQTISGVGRATLKRPPTALRMYVEVFGKGKTLEEALAKLKDRRQAARAQLEALKADPQSIEFGSPSRSNPQSEQRRRFEAMVIERMRSTGRRVPKGLQAPKSFTVSARLTAEWPLKADSPEEALLAAHLLEEKVKAADLTGAETSEALSAEEEEMAEEMAGMMAYGGDEEVKPGTPAFVYVARITDPDCDQAMAEAFQKARANALRLARAAGTQLGPLVGLSGGGGGTTSPFFGDSMYGYEYQSYVQRLMGQEDLSEMAAEPNEAVSSDPGSVEFGFHVMAVFGLETP